MPLWTSYETTYCGGQFVLNNYSLLFMEKIKFSFNNNLKINFFEKKIGFY